jgi:hypothetical protein
MNWLGLSLKPVTPRIPIGTSDSFIVADNSVETEGVKRIIEIYPSLLSLLSKMKRGLRIISKKHKLHANK